LAVELLISVLQHPRLHYAPGEVAKDIADATSTPLGSVPHQLRGFLTHFATLPLIGHAYPKCTACSAIILEEFNKRGIEFLLEAFNNPSYLENLTGLAQMSKENVDIEWVGDDGEDDF